MFNYTSYQIKEAMTAGETQEYPTTFEDVTQYNSTIFKGSFAGYDYTVDYTIFRAVIPGYKLEVKLQYVNDIRLFFKELHKELLQLRQDLVKEQTQSEKWLAEGLRYQLTGEISQEALTEMNKVYR